MVDMVICSSVVKYFFTIVNSYSVINCKIKFNSERNVHASSSFRHRLC
jgi:hypothetical protein